MWYKKINTLLTKIQSQRPLILNISNVVTMDFIANGLLSLGASPLMSQSTNEVAELVALANVVVINLGTLDKQFVELCHYVCEAANKMNKPIILDPVGAGASVYRTVTSRDLLNKYYIAIVRGNASEVASLMDDSVVTKGVDSNQRSETISESAKIISKYYHTTLLISGEVDVVVKGDEVHYFTFGSDMMPKITGSGCLLSAVVGAFQAVEVNTITACSAAAIFYSWCGERAALQSKGPASFKVNFLDTLSLAPEVCYATH